MNVEDDLANAYKAYRSRDASAIESHISELIKEAREQNQSARANHLWALLETLRVQEHYISAFKAFQQRRFYDGWCSLERAEIQASVILQNFPSWPKRFWIQFIIEHVDRWQQLFPYTLFFSPGFRVVERICSICGERVMLRTSCGHRKGHVYDGELCFHIITKSELLEISVVDNPVQKYSVAFSADGKDHYDYRLVDYVVRGLRSPFNGFRVLKTKRALSSSERASVRSKDRCPCGSRKPFGNCCMSKGVVQAPHVDIEFDLDPPKTLPRFVSSIASPVRGHKG